MIQPIPFFGGKGQLAKWIYSHFPKHEFLVDTFGGSGVIILNDTTPGIYNDIDPDLFWLMYHLKHNLREFLAIVKTFSYEFNTCRCASKYHQLPTSLLRTVYYYTWQRQRYSGGEAAARGFNYTGKKTWDNMLTKLPTISNRLNKIQLKNLDIFKLLTMSFPTNTLLYLDPPYSKKTRTRGLYKYEFIEHTTLYQYLRNTTHMFVLSSYEAGLPFKCIQKQTKNQMHKPRTEYLYTNTS